MSYKPPTGLLREAESLIEELEKIDTSEPPPSGGGGGGNGESTAGASGALIAAAGLAGTAYFFMSDQE